MRKAFLLLHRWLGLAAALVIAFLGLSGAALVFRPELDTKFNPRLMRVAPNTGHKASFQSITDETRQAFPNHKISFLFAARTPEQTHELWLDNGKLRVHVDPTSGKILGSRLEAQGFYTWLFRAHTQLFMGESGESLAGWTGLVLASLSLSGLVLWWPRTRSGWKRAFRPHWKTNWKGRLYELHRAGGFWLCALLLNASLSGASLVWPESATALAAHLGISQARKPKAEVGQWQNLDALVATANRVFPDGQITRLTFPAKPGAPFVVRKKLAEEIHPNGQNNIALDPSTGKVLSITDSRKAKTGARLLNLRYPLHTGRWAGNFSRVLAVLSGIGAAFMALSGVVMWAKRWWRVRRQHPI